MDDVRFKEIEEVVSKGRILNERIRDLLTALKAANDRLEKASYHAIEIIGLNGTVTRVRLENEAARQILILALKKELDDLDYQYKKLDI